MGSHLTLEEYLNEIHKRISLQMPKIREEIKIYELRAKEGKLTSNPIPAPQFNEQT